MNKFLLLIMLSTLNQYCVAFEIKPIGFNSDKWIGEQIPAYKADDQGESCDGGVSGIWYKAFNTYPVHEIITVTAAKSYCDSPNYIKSISEKNNNIFTLECGYISGKKNRSSSNSPLISGSFFNDDPTGRIRAEGYGVSSILRGVIDFGSTIKQKGSVTYESHNGENQFLHSMKSQGEDSNATRERIVEYIAENFNLARYINEKLHDPNKKSIDLLKTLLDKPISHDSKYGFFLKYESNQDVENGCKYEKYINLFYCGGSFEWGEYASKAELNKIAIIDPAEETRTHARTLALLALGSALHAIQDSYSTSHTKREENPSKVIEFYQYDDGKNSPPLENKSKHCQHDAYVKVNSASIENAQQKSSAFLELITINENHNKNGTAQLCREAMKNWLKQNIFQLGNEGTESLNAVAARPDTCVAENP